ncbi:MAG: HAD family hydrolase [Nanoarchaeota archaeon]|nr:HAD family hydrolase [Nanoarchaeota archaeon]
MKAIIFDFDGVISDSFEFHLEKIREFANIDLSEQTYRDMHNGNFFDMVPKEIKNIKWLEYRDFIYHEQSILNIKNDIGKVLKKLNEKYDLYIISSGGRKNIAENLLNNGLSTIFKDILGMELESSKAKKFKFIFDKYNLDNLDCLFVTDTLGDILEANNVGVKSVAVNFGFHNNVTLKKGNPSRIISKIEELFEVLDDLN